MYVEEHSFDQLHLFYRTMLIKLQRICYCGYCFVFMSLQNHKINLSSFGYSMQSKNVMKTHIDDQHIYCLNSSWEKNISKSRLANLEMESEDA